MTEIGIVGGLFLISLVANAAITRWSTKRVLGINVSFIRSSLIVAGRSLAALLAGFSIGYVIRVGLQDETPDKVVMLSSMTIVSLLSFFAYWLLLGKMTNTSISLWGMTKTVAAETVMLIVVSSGIAIVLSFIFYTFK